MLLSLVPLRGLSLHLSSSQPIPPTRQFSGLLCDLLYPHPRGAHHPWTVASEALKNELPAWASVTAVLTTNCILMEFFLDWDEVNNDVFMSESLPCAPTASSRNM